MRGAIILNGLKFPVGISNFAKIRDEGYYYIDKTNLITEILESGIAEVTLITRPRRFGKTLGMSMLADFLMSANTAASISPDYLSPRTLIFVING